MKPLHLVELRIILLQVGFAIFLAISSVLTCLAQKKKSVKDRKPPSSRKSKKSPSPSPSNTDDTFEHHAPVQREARRADEIRKKRAVSGSRDDYKTFNKNTMPESDFDNSISQH